MLDTKQECGECGAPDGDGRQYLGTTASLGWDSLGYAAIGGVALETLSAVLMPEIMHLMHTHTHHLARL